MFHLIMLGLITGLGLGSIYALVAVSYSIALAASGVFNFAQGAVVGVGALVSYRLAMEANLSLFLVLAVVILVGAALGLITYILAVHPFANHSGSLTHLTLVSTLGLGLAMVALTELVFGSDVHSVDDYVGSAPIMVLDVPVRPSYILMIGVVLAISVVLELFMTRSSVGLVLRAAVLDREGASLLAISSVRVAAGAFLLAGILAALAGFLIAPVTSASPYLGNDIALYGFAAMALGGYGSFRGAICGGLLVGMVVGVAPVFFDTHLTIPMAFLLLLVVLTIRPVGLFGSRGLLGSAAIREV